MKAFLVRWGITTAAVWVATWLLPGIDATTTFALFAASLCLGLVNAFVRPVLLILSVPFILVTMGLFILIINALLLWGVAGIVPGFTVDGFWNAFWGGLIIGMVSWVLSAFFHSSDGKVHLLTHHAQIKQAEGRVINE